jgi:positive regulator of sigma E activity
VKRLGMREGAMSNVRNWASTAVVAVLILLAPIIGFALVVMLEMLGDLMARAGATAIWPVVAGAMAWVLLRKFGGQPHTSRLRSEGA